MPSIERRRERTYLGRRAVVSLADLEIKVPELTAEVADRAAQHGDVPAGRPFVRYHVINMPARMDIEVGIPVDPSSRAEADTELGELPEGRYATSTFTGIGNGVSANKHLIDWITAHGEEAAARTSANGEVFECRYETVMSDTAAEPDQTTWQIEIAIKLRD